MNKKNLEFDGIDIKKSLESFVHHGVLLKTKKNGEDAYMENPEFKKKPKKEQEKVFAIIKQEEELGLHDFIDPLPPNEK